MFKHLQVEMRTFSDFDKLYRYGNILPDVPPLLSNQHICLKKLTEEDVQQVSPSAGNSFFLKKLPEFPAIPALIFHTGTSAFHCLLKFDRELNICSVKVWPITPKYALSLYNPY